VIMSQSQSLPSFVDPKAAEEFQCCICIELFKSAVQIGACGHVFCFACISRYQSGRDIFPCPSCRQSCDSSSMGRVPFIDRQVNNLKVRCPNSQVTPERAEYLKRKQANSKKTSTQNTDSHSHGDRKEVEHDGDGDGDGNGGGEDGEEDEDEHTEVVPIDPGVDEAKPCGPMRIERKRKLSVLGDHGVVNTDRKRYKTSGGDVALCEWVGALMDLDGHIASCPFQLISCTFCRQSMLQWELADHHQFCDKYPVECGSCKQTGIPRCKLRDHRETVCPSGIVRCSHCGNAYRRSRLVDHQKYHCLEVKVPCLLEEFGCNEEVKRRHQKSHIEERVVDHLGIIVGVMTAQKAKLEKQEMEIRELKKQVRRLSEIPLLQQAINQQNRRVMHPQRAVFDLGSVTFPMRFQVNNGANRNFST